ncbi:MAG: DUF1217 domain-containing protein [Pseudomonadota bacterium]
MADSFGLPIVDYQVATANQTTLMAQFQRTPSYTQAVTNYQTAVSKITTVDQFLGDYKTLQFALNAYGMGDIIDQKGVLKQLLTQNPTSSDSLAQKLGNQKYIAFAKAFWSLSTDGGAGISSQASINTTVARYGQAQYQQWASQRTNDPALATALSARQTLQDAVDVSDVGSLYATFQNAPSTQKVLTYYKTNIASINSVADFVANTQILNTALTAYGIDPSTISTTTVQNLLTQDPTDKTSVAYNNPDYQAFANAFASLNTDDGQAIALNPNVTSVLNLYQQRAFSIAITTNTADQNQSMFGTEGAAKITRILANASSETGLSLATSYYSAHIAGASTAQAFAADKQLVGTALSAYGLSNVSHDALMQLLTQDPNDSASLAQTSPEYAAFAKAFSYAAVLGGSRTTAKTNITAVQNAYTANQLQSVIQSDIAASSDQAARNAKVDEKSSAPLNIYQVLGDNDLSTILLGAYGQPISVGALDPDKQVEVFTHAGFDPATLNSTDAIDKLIQRYMASDSAQSNSTTPDSVIVSLFQSQGASDQPITLDLSGYFGLSAGQTTSNSGGATSYLLNFYK